ncbi:MAG TPA: 50S ribosomal protein L6 [Blastocatellia bacterium]|nr:50S ribosomal protein L6 [Blastocatellia bacterium]
MSRIGKKPIQIPKGVDVKIDEGEVNVKGPKGQLSTPLPSGVTAKVDNGSLLIERQDDEHRAVHGLARALIANSIKGVTDGFTRQLDVVGVGYKVEQKAGALLFSLGYSHPIEFPIPKGMEVKLDRMQKTIPQYQTTISITGTDKQRVGQLAADMRGLRQPDAYKGKGVRYSEETLKLKPGKTGK